MKRAALVVVLVLLVAGLSCQRKNTPPPGATRAPQPAKAEQTAGAYTQGTLLLINSGSPPGTYASCSLDGEPLPYQIKGAQYVEFPISRSGMHRLECAIEAFSYQVSFDCSHPFESFGNEKVYLNIERETLPGQCEIVRLSTLPDKFLVKYRRAIGN